MLSPELHAKLLVSYLVPKNSFGISEILAQLTAAIKQRRYIIDPPHKMLVNEQIYAIEHFVPNAPSPAKGKVAEGRMGLVGTSRMHHSIA